MEERREDVREIIEVYRQPEPQEVVEEYSRTLPGWQEQIEEEFEEFLAMRRRRKRRRGLIIFLACLAVIIVLAVLAKLLIPGSSYASSQPYPDDDWEGEPLTGEIFIPTVPYGQGGALTIVRQQGEALSPREVYQQVNPSVVTVITQHEEGMSVGTGVIFSEDGYILTNYHVLDGGSGCMVLLDTGYTLNAAYVAGDIPNDLAILKVDMAGFPAAEFGDSDLLSVGDPVYAIGNPLGVELRGTLTDGLVSAINRDVWVDDRYMTLIQTNAALNSGNSGGPLINEFGQVVGINVIKMTSRYSNVEGLGFAIPSASVERITNDLLTYGECQPEPLLGISVITVAEEVEPGVRGLLVDEVTPGGVGAAAGIQKGDYLLSADGEELLTSTDLLRVRRHHYVGETMEIVLWRDGLRLNVTLQLTQSVED